MQDVLLPQQPLREMHLFSGSGGGILGGILLGHTTICACEINPYCRQVLFQRQRDGLLPRFPIWDDAKTFDGKQWRGLVDIICGGFPCQDISHFGSRSERKGIKGSRSGLWAEFARIIEEVRPSVAFIENNPQLRYRGLDVVLQDLAQMRYNAVWDIFSAKEVGSCHERKRIWIMAWNPDRPYALQVEKVQEQSKSGTKSVGDGWWTEKRQSRIPRMADGVANRLERFASIGNGQIPSVVEIAWKELRKRALAKGDCSIFC